MIYLNYIIYSKKKINYILDNILYNILQNDYFKVISVYQKFMEFDIFKLYNNII